MEVCKLLTQYNQKLMQVLSQLEEINGDLIKNSIHRINDLFKQIEKSIILEARWSLASGLSAGVLGAGSALLPEAEKLKVVAQVLAPVAPKCCDFASSLVRADETKLQLEQRLLQDHLLSTQREIEKKYEDAKHTMEQKISGCMDLKAQGDRLH